MFELRKSVAACPAIGKPLKLLCPLLLIGLLLYLPACGFHLRGHTSLPAELESIQLLAEDLDARQRALLSRQLQQAGASLQVTDNPQQVQLRVSLGSLASRHLADAAGSGKTIVRLSRQLTYRLSKAGGEPLIETTTLLQQLDLELDDNNLLDSDERIRRAGESLDRALIEQLIFSLKRL